RTRSVCSAACGACRVRAGICMRMANRSVRGARDVGLSAESVSKTFGRAGRLAGRSGGIRAVNSVSVRVEPGDFVAIVGESGSGKTTLARILLGLIPPDAGAVRLDGVDLSRMDRRQLRQYR